MIRIREYLHVKRFFHINPFDHLENLFPNIYLKTDKHLDTVITLRKLIYLSEHYTKQYLFWCWKKSYWAIEVTENHVSSWTKDFLVIPCSPVPCEPLEVFPVEKIERINFSESWISILVSQLPLRSLSLVVHSSPNFPYIHHTVLFFFLSSHCREFDGSNIKINHDGLVLLPERPLSFQGHTVEAVKLLPKAVISFDKPGPI